MKEKTLNDLLAELHREQTLALLDAIKDPDCPASTFEAARKFLQDNKITSELEGNKPLQELTTELPYGDPTLRAVE